DGFLISGSQTGQLPLLNLAQVAEVLNWDLKRGAVVARGLSQPSSESLSHAAVYASSPHARCVFHVHSPPLWQAAARLDLPTTPPDIGYGTQAMAQAVGDMVAERPSGLLVMQGHEDGVLAWGESVGITGNLLLYWWYQSLQRGADWHHPHETVNCPFSKG
ncbi:MAG: class II aldolase/adducin family protein, partial [Gammaproteobacteria bacterium]|nr:class II aldolase/adducin family protein [Gammaproteobacteria bacterium]